MLDGGLVGGIFAVPLTIEALHGLAIVVAIVVGVIVGAYRIVNLHLEMKERLRRLAHDDTEA
jgi:fructose-specific phosphotransferase system IIC component